MRSKEYKTANQQSLAKINTETKQIEVSPRFYLVSDEMKEFIMLDLKWMLKNGGRQFTADEQALDEIMKLYPKKKMGYWIKEFTLVLYNERPDEYSLKRIENLSRYCAIKNLKETNK